MWVARVPKRSAGKRSLIPRWWDRLLARRCSTVFLLLIALFPDSPRRRFSIVADPVRVQFPGFAPFRPMEATPSSKDRERERRRYYRSLLQGTTSC